MIGNLRPTSNSKEILDRMRIVLGAERKAESVIILERRLRDFFAWVTREQLTLAALPRDAVMRYMRSRNERVTLVEMADDLAAICTLFQRASQLNFSLPTDITIPKLEDINPKLQKTIKKERALRTTAARLPATTAPSTALWTLLAPVWEYMAKNGDTEIIVTPGGYTRKSAK